MEDNTASSVDFDNYAFMLDKLSREVSECYKNERHHEYILCEHDALNFLINLGQATATLQYARFGKISKELANRTLSRFIDTFQPYFELMDNYTQEEEQE